jgi:hypothetical protein
MTLFSSRNHPRQNAIVPRGFSPVVRRKGSPPLLGILQEEECLLSDHLQIGLLGIINTISIPERKIILFVGYTYPPRRPQH